MNGVRAAISVFLAAVFVLLILGWRWTTAHQAPAQAAGSHVVLGLGIAAELWAFYVLWQRRPTLPR